MAPALRMTRFNKEMQPVFFFFPTAHLQLCLFFLVKAHSPNYWLPSNAKAEASRRHKDEGSLTSLLVARPERDHVFSTRRLGSGVTHSTLPLRHLFPSVPSNLYVDVCLLSQTWPSNGIPYALRCKSTSCSLPEAQTPCSEQVRQTSRRSVVTPRKSSP